MENIEMGKVIRQEEQRREESSLCDTWACVCVTAVGTIAAQGEDHHHHHAFVCSVERPPMINVCHG